MMHDRETIRREITAFLTRAVPESKTQVEGDQNLFATGILDSFQIVSLVAFIEDTFDVPLDFDTLEEKDFQNLSALTELVYSAAT